MAPRVCADCPTGRKGAEIGDQRFDGMGKLRDCRTDRGPARSGALRSEQLDEGGRAAVLEPHSWSGGSEDREERLVRCCSCAPGRSRARIGYQKGRHRGSKGTP